MQITLRRGFCYGGYKEEPGIGGTNDMPIHYSVGEFTVKKCHGRYSRQGRNVVAKRVFRYLIEVISVLGSDGLEKRPLHAAYARLCKESGPLHHHAYIRRGM